MRKTAFCFLGGFGAAIAACDRRAVKGANCVRLIESVFVGSAHTRKELSSLTSRLTAGLLSRKNEARRKQDKAPADCPQSFLIFEI